MHLHHQDNGLQSASSSCTPEYQALEASAADGSSGEEDVEAATHIMTEEENKFHDAPNDLHEYGEEVTEHAVSCTLSESSSHIGSDTYNYKVINCSVINVSTFSIVIIKEWLKPKALTSLLWNFEVELPKA